MSLRESQRSIEVLLLASKNLVLQFQDSNLKLRCGVNENFFAVLTIESIFQKRDDDVNEVNSGIEWNRTDGRSKKN